MRWLLSPGPEIVVTGANGFVGTALVRHLRTEECRVIAIGRTAVKGLDRTIEDYGQLTRRSDERLVHLAQSNILDGSAKNARYLCDAAVQTTEKLAQEYGSAMVYVSSATVYGDHYTEPVDETAILAGTGIYNEMKIACENAEIAAQLNFGRSGDSSPIKVKRLDPARDWIDVQDAAAGLASLSIEAVGGIYNLGSGRAVTVRRIVGIMAQLAGQASRPIATATEVATSSSHSYLCLDTLKIRATTGWTTEHNLEVSLKNYLQREGIIDVCAG
jgi:UDP-glucose 4-epimerase